MEQKRAELTRDYLVIEGDKMSRKFNPEEYAKSCVKQDKIRDAIKLITQMLDE
jgi:hypothetical protein